MYLSPLPSTDALFLMLIVIQSFSTNAYYIGFKMKRVAVFYLVKARALDGGWLRMSDGVQVGGEGLVTMVMSDYETIVS